MDAQEQEVYVRLRERIATLESEVRAAKEAVPLALAAEKAHSVAARAMLLSVISFLGMVAAFIAALRK